jgi:hypothetical protein
MNDKRPLSGGRMSSRSTTSVNGLDSATSININYALYKRSAYYRLLIRARLAADVWRFGHIEFDFGKNRADLEETEEELVHQVWLDLPVGTPSLKRDAA